MGRWTSSKYFSYLCSFGKTKFSDQLIAAVATDYNNEIEDLPKEQRYEKYFDEVQDATYVDEPKNKQENAE